MIWRATNETSSRLLFGIEQRDQVNDLLRDILNTTIDWDFKQIWNNANTNIEDLQRENTKRYNLRRKAKVGDYVEIRNVETIPGINKKLLPKFKEPYVKRILDHDRYIETDVDGFQLNSRSYTGVVSFDQMRPYIYNYLCIRFYFSLTCDLM